MFLSQFVSVLSDAVALFTCWLLLRAAWLKAADTTAFQETLTNYGLTNNGFKNIARLLTFFIIGFEASCGVLTLLPATRAMGACLSILLLAGYLILMAWQLSQKKILDCGCATEEILISPLVLLRNGALILLIIPCILGTSSIHLFTLPITLPIMIAAGGSLILFYLSTEILIANSQKL